MNNIIDLFKEINVVTDFGNNLIKNYSPKDSSLGEYNYLVNNISPHGGYLLTSFAFSRMKKTILYVASNLYQANKAYDKFIKLVGYDNVCLYVVDEFVSTELVAVSSDLKNERIETLKAIYNNEAKIIITHPQALLRPLIKKDNFFGKVIRLKKHENIDFNTLFASLVALGYKKTSITEVVGDFSVRGEIIDIYSNYYKEPVRVSFFDNEIEDIRFFDLETQRSTGSLDELIIFPSNELIYDKQTLERTLKRINKIADLPDFIKRDLIDFENYENLEKINKYIKYIEEEPETFLDYLDEKLVFYSEFSELKNSYLNLINDLNNYLEMLDVPKQVDLFFFYDFFNITYNINNKIFLSFVKQSLQDIKLNKIYSLNSYSVIDYQNDIKNLIEDLKANRNKTFIFAFETDERLYLLKEILNDSNLDVFNIDSFRDVKKNSINLIKSTNALSYGMLELGYEVITETEIFKTIKSKRPKFRSELQSSKKISSKEDLKIGDYVVHYDYGIARYLGIKTIDLKDVKNDYISLEFENMELYIPVEKISLLEKYQGTEGSIPKLTSVGRGEWEKKKERIKKNLESIAEDLIKTEAAREKATGYKYPKDSEYQKLFESDFIYEETLDQLRAINEIKYDMESGKIIDRLICGDVGYGKTEVAMRIAFKTVFEGMQVAYLAPTTILTRQHYYTFKERFAKFGIRVELMNRLVPRKEQLKIIEDIKAGLVDIVIGTHRLLSDDFKYNNLGLLIIDEEQRFGVIHKEKIKKLKVNVNVLTLTATPIPRTLQMSVVGLKQMSLIETPPKDRYPIQTYVMEENDIIIKEAIYRELSRGGQVFYLHNRVDGLDRLARKINRLIPEARIVQVHGQMSKAMLENNIQDFIDLKYDVLLCTTIIETGIDIPNTNTLIIDRADYLGLSQIYQIRGRVGRTDRIAYAYLLFERDKVITDDAVKRLNAIKEFTNLGSGYKIAVRDLAIRGAGDILGKEQSGFVDAIGLDMYLKLLSEAINKVKGIKEEKEEVDIKIDVSKYVSHNYVSDDEIKILIHKEIHKIKTAKDKIELIKEFTDRFGKLNEEILIYIEERYLQTLLRKYEINNLMEATNQVTIIFKKAITKKIDAEKLFINATNISRDIDFEYKNEKLIMKIKKESKSKSWVYKLSKLLETAFYKES